MTSYLVHAMVVSSPVDIAAGPAGARATPDVSILISQGHVAVPAGSVLADSRRPDGRPGYLLTRAEGRWTVTFPGVASATFRPDEPVVEIVVAPAVSSGLLSVLIAGPVLSAVAASRGHELLHSSAVCWSGGQGSADVVGLVGPPGSGKSSIAMLLAGPERPMFSDDALRVDLDDTVRVHRGTTSSRLRTRVALDDHVKTSTSADGRWVVRAEAPSPATGTLALLLTPLLSPAFDDVRIRELTGSEALLPLVADSPIAGVVAPDLLVRRLDWAARLAGRVRIAALEVPWRGGRLDDRDRDALSALVGRVVRGSPDSVAR